MHLYSNAKRRQHHHARFVETPAMRDYEWHRGREQPALCVLAVRLNLGENGGPTIKETDS
jgi:hypothetical protein